MVLLSSCKIWYPCPTLTDSSFFSGTHKAPVDLRSVWTLRLTLCPTSTKVLSDLGGMRVPKRTDKIFTVQTKTKSRLVRCRTHGVRNRANRVLSCTCVRAWVHVGPRPVCGVRNSSSGNFSLPKERRLDRSPFRLPWGSSPVSTPFYLGGGPRYGSL